MKKKHSDLFVLLSILYVSCVLISNILATKMINVFGLSITGGAILFPLSYIIGDILTEVYGRRSAFLIIIFGFISNLLMVVFFSIAIILPYPNFWTNQDAFSIILSNTPRLFIASVLGYFAGGFSNSFIMEKLKTSRKAKGISFRVIISTLVGEFLDTGIFLTVGFVGTMDSIELISMIGFQTVFKIMIEVLLVPITIILAKRISKYEIDDSVDKNEK